MNKFFFRDVANVNFIKLDETTNDSLTPLSYNVDVECTSELKYIELLDLLKIPAKTLDNKILVIEKRDSPSPSGGDIQNNISINGFKAYNLDNIVRVTYISGKTQKQMIEDFTAKCMDYPEINTVKVSLKLNTHTELPYNSSSVQFPTISLFDSKMMPCFGEFVIEYNSNFSPNCGDCVRSSEELVASIKSLRRSFMLPFDIFETNNHLIFNENFMIDTNQHSLLAFKNNEKRFPGAFEEIIEHIRGACIRAHVKKISWYVAPYIALIKEF